ncbi:MAG: acyltransferase, partial [Bacteroidetes bacterium]|nr:acyltransferase [Bacteroidota bacterium]
MGSIRTLLALSVVVFHSYFIFGERLIGGLVAVQAFYLISGFYMAMILNEKYKAGKGSYKLFITNRFLRIYPAYWV